MFALESKPTEANEEQANVEHTDENVKEQIDIPLPSQDDSTITTTAAATTTINTISITHQSEQQVENDFIPPPQIPKQEAADTDNAHPQEVKEENVSLEQKGESEQDKDDQLLPPSSDTMTIIIPPSSSPATTTSISTDSGLEATTKRENEANIAVQDIAPPPVPLQEQQHEANKTEESTILKENTDTIDILPPQETVQEKATSQQTEQSPEAKDDIIPPPEIEKQSALDGTTHPNGIIGEDVELMEVVCVCRALYGRTATETNELSFPKGAIIDVFDKDDSGWWLAQYNGMQGYVPRNYVELL